MPQTVSRMKPRALRRFADSSPRPFIEGIRAAREKIVARNEDNRAAFLKARGFSKAETANVADLTHGQGVNVVFNTIGGDTLTKSPLALADAGRVVSIVDIAQPQNLIEAWGKNAAAYHFVFTRQDRGKLDAVTNLVERGLIKPVIGEVLPLARVDDAHELLEAGSSLGLRGKVVVDVMGQTVELPTPR